LDALQDGEDRKLSALQYANEKRKIELDGQVMADYNRDLQKLDQERQFIEEEKTLREQSFQEEMDFIDQANLNREQKDQLTEDAKARHTERMNELDLERARIAQQTAQAEKTAAEIKRQAYTESFVTGAELVIEDEKAVAKIKGYVEVGEGLRTGATFIETGDPRELAASLKHFLSAKQFFKAAQSSGGGSGGGGGGGGGGGSRGGRNRRDRNGSEYRNEGPPVNLEVNFHGAALLDESQLNEFVVNQFSPAVEKLTNAGRISQSWTQK